jgi:hypothetical protein
LALAVLGIIITTKMRISAAYPIVLLLFSASAAAHGPHVHGKGELEITIQGAAIRGAFRTPMESLLGFEHLPKNDAQRKALDDLRQQLKSPATIVMPNREAECSARMAEATSSLLTGMAKGEHSDLEFRFSFECGVPDRLNSLEVVALNQFRRLSEVRAVLVTAKGQRSFAVKKKDPKISVAP